MRIETLVIITRENEGRKEVLLGLKQGGSEIGDGTLNGPGGKFDLTKDVTILDCAIRETEEEIGIALDPAKTEKCAIITFYAGGVPTSEVHVFRTSHFTGEPHETEKMVPDWYDINRLPVDDMLESDHRWLPQLLRGRKFRTNVYYREKAKGFLKIDPFLPFAE